MSAASRTRKIILPIGEQRALRETDYFDSRNVQDRFKGIPTEDIKAFLGQESSGLTIIASNEIKDFNWGSVVRSVNSFGAKRIIFTGRRAYNRRGAVGAQNYTQVDYDERPVTELFADLRAQGYTIIAAEYDERFDMVSLERYTFDPKTAIIFGEEGLSLSEEILKDVDDVVYIPMHGSVKSLNLASAATTFMYAYNVSTRYPNTV